MANKTKTIQELNLKDDFLFGKVMSDSEICRKVLEKILNVPIKKVEFPVTQKNINTALDGGGIRLDAYINDERDTIYSIEMQCGGEGELPRKSRYFQCNIDSSLISPRESCTKLKKSYIIFICTFDPFSDGRHIYTFENRCLEDLSLTLGDETTEVFLSTKGERDDVDAEMKEFLAYIENSTDTYAQQASSPLVKEIHKKVSEVKLNKDMEIQFYHDNLMNPAVGGTYRFIGKVVDEIAAMYADAGVALPGIHLGGDEVPEGAWDGSRAVASMMEERGLNSRHAVQGEYVRNISGLMRERGIPLYGWQDICTDYDADFHAEVAPTVGGMDCWVSSPEIEKNVAVKGVKSGYPVIISNVDYFYMDMLYSPNPEEKGLYWGGFTDELRTLSGYPDLICPRDGEEPGKVIGVSGKLFAETIRDKADMERLLFPKSLGLAERGWNATPTYSDEDFNILIATKELPRLSAKDVEFHLRQPGIIVEDKRIKMNSPYPDAAIFYTLDGSTPTAATAALYEGPVDLPADCAIVKAILYKDGKSSVTTTYKSN